MDVDFLLMKKKKEDISRRDFLSRTAIAMGAFGVGVAGWVMIDSMNPAADTLAKSVVEVDLSHVQPGERIMTVWRQLPIFIHHRTPEEIRKVRNENSGLLRVPQRDEARVKKGHDEWLVVVGVCTFHDCIVMGGKAGQPRGEWGGRKCPCCGSSYDISGRVRNGPAPLNLHIPEYRFVTDKRIRMDSHFRGFTVD